MINGGNMKKIWLWIKKFDKELITAAIESGVNAIVVDNDKEEKEIIEKIKELGLIDIFTPRDKEIVLYQYKDKTDEDKIAKLSKEKKVVLETESWQIIPWENLIAKNSKFYVFINDENELEQALNVLEKGVYGVILRETNIANLKKLINKIISAKDKIDLTEAEILSIKLLPSGDRVCVDTCNIMNLGEGMLIGNSSHCLFLIHSETIENPYCATRPFRVNAGAVHAYIKTDITTTKYLSELESGQSVLIVNHKGEARNGIVGRSKIETRPLVLITASANGREYSVILQNAETINLIEADNKQPVSVTKLKKGDKVLVEINEGGRHFGMKIEENIIEH